MARLSLVLILIVFSHSVSGQEKHTENTLKLAGGKHPAATIQDMSWLAGHWMGKAMGGMVEEVWTPAAAKSMMGSYRLIRHDTLVVFYELLALYEEDHSLTLRLKHFHKDLTAWEEKLEVREFKLLKIEKDKAWFDGMTFAKVNSNALRVYVAIEMKNGDIMEEVFDYTRRNALK